MPPSSFSPYICGAQTSVSWCEVYFALVAFELRLPGTRSARLGIETKRGLHDADRIDPEPYTPRSVTGFGEQKAHLHRRGSWNTEHLRLGRNALLCINGVLQRSYKTVNFW